MGNFIEEYLMVSPDPRSTRLDLMGSPLQIGLILTIYFLFVKKWGPLLMQSRDPFQLKSLLIIYNTFQIFTNGYLVYGATPLILHHRKWVGRCFQIDETNPEIARFIVLISYAFCMVKVLDLFDTIFFVLRKRYKQVSFLHFYHHFMVCLVCCLVFRYVPNGHLGIMGYVNSIVHTVMYFYYLLTIIQPRLKHSVWWKKYITIMQMTQFVFLSLFLFYPLSKGQNCGYPFKTMQFTLFQNFVLFFLFSNFYIKTYVTKAKPRE